MAPELKKTIAKDAPVKISPRISVLFWADILVGYALFVMQDYLTSVWNLSFTHAAGILNVWGGIVMLLPAILLFLVDTKLGNRTMLIISSVSFSVGIGLVTMSTPPVLGGSCKGYEEECIGRKQKALFYAGMALIAVGVAGNEVSLRPFLKEQERGDREEEPNCCVVLVFHSFIVVVALTGAIGLPYVKPWKLRFGIPAICTTVATLIFFTGICIKPFRQATGERKSPITNVLRVYWAFWFKLCKPIPKDEKMWYKRSEDEKRTHTRCLGCLEKAAIKKRGDVDEEEQVRKWRLSSVRDVEEAKIAIRMIPMWLTFVVCGIISSVSNTYFVEQAKNLDRHIKTWNVPLQVFKLPSTFSSIIYNLLSSCFLKKDNAQTASLGIRFSMLLSVMCCITAAKIEHKRLGVVRSHGLFDKPDDDIPMSIYWLTFQFVLLAGLDSYLDDNIKKFFKHEAPLRMESYFEYFAKFVKGLGFMLSVFTVYVAGRISERNGGRNWFQRTLNESRLDRYYWVLAGMAAVNLLVFFLLAKIYKYQVPRKDAGEGGEGGRPSYDAPDTGGDPNEKPFDNFKCCCCG